MANFVKHGISPVKDDKEGFELVEERKRNQEEKGEKKSENRQRKLKKKEKNEEIKSQGKEMEEKTVNKETSDIDGVDGKSEKINTKRKREPNAKKNNSKEVFSREKNLKEIEKNNIDIIEVRDRQRKSANREEKSGEEGDNNNNNKKKYFGDFRKNMPLIVSKHREKEGQKKLALLDQVYYKIDWQMDEEGIRPKSGYFSLDDLKLYCPLLLIEYLEKKGRLVNDETEL